MSDSGSQDRRRDEQNERHHPYAEAEAKMKRSEAEAEGYGERQRDEFGQADHVEDRVRPVAEEVGRRGHDEPDERTEQH